MKTSGLEEEGIGPRYKSLEEDIAKTRFDILIKKKPHKQDNNTSLVDIASKYTLVLKFRNMLTLFYRSIHILSQICFLM